jgi:hypothetical protein
MVSTMVLKYSLSYISVIDPRPFPDQQAIRKLAAENPQAAPKSASPEGIGKKIDLTA